MTLMHIVHPSILISYTSTFIESWSVATSPFWGHKHRTISPAPPNCFIYPTQSLNPRLSCPCNKKSPVVGMITSWFQSKSSMPPSQGPSSGLLKTRYVALPRFLVVTPSRSSYLSTPVSFQPLTCPPLGNVSEGEGVEWERLGPAHAVLGKHSQVVTRAWAQPRGLVRGRGRQGVKMGGDGFTDCVCGKICSQTLQMNLLMMCAVGTTVCLCLWMYEWYAQYERHSNITCEFLNDVCDRNCS